MDPHLRNVWLRGEISNYKLHSRGHMYMTIKDANARLQAVMFAGNARSMKFRPENGMNVLIKGEISVYESYGQYQLYIQEMEPDGIGALYLAYEQLKEKLHKEGLFDDVHKKKIPAFPKSIGIITSPTGAAVRDIITTIRRRYPIASVTVLPVLVQGPQAADSIAEAIRKANEAGTYDTLIVGRGGGSIEELWSFNEEIVGRAIFASAIPVISAVGHETDTTISDFIADLRAPTPTGAAEMAVPNQQELKDRIQVLQRTLTRELSRELSKGTEQLKRLKQSYAFRYPEQLIRQKNQLLDSYLEQLHRRVDNYRKDKEKSISYLYQRLSAQHPENQIKQAQHNLGKMVRQQDLLMNQLLEKKMVKLSNTMDKLTLVNPLAIMKRGFALPLSDSGNLIKTVKEVKADDLITLKLSDGKLKCQVLTTEEEAENEK